VTPEQIILMITIPIIVNSIFTAALFMLVNSRISDLRSDMNARFTALEKLMDAKFESLEREIHHGEGS